MMMMNPDSGTPDAGNVVMASLMVTGMLTGTISAAPPTVGYDADTSTSAFTLSSSTTGGPFTVDINYGFGGRPMVQAYMEGSTGFTCTVTITRGTGSDAGTTADTWVARDNATSGANAGTCTLSLSTIGVPNSMGYPTNGTLTVTAPNMGGQSTGSVSLTGTF